MNVDDIVTGLIDLTVKQSIEEVDDSRLDEQVKSAGSNRCTLYQTGTVPYGVYVVHNVQ